MKKIYIGKGNVISVYKFMEMMGLKCELKRNIFISHKIMIGKLTKRAKLFPNSVRSIIRIPFDIIKYEDIMNGKILLVEDDYKIIMAYKNNIFVPNSGNLCDEERKKIRDDIISCYCNREIDCYINGEELTIGYCNYLYKKYIRGLVQERLYLESIALEGLKEREYDVTEKVVRIKTMENRRRYY